MKTHEMEVAPEFREALQKHLGEERYDLWFAGQTRIELVEHELAVYAPDRFTKDWMAKHFRSTLAVVCEEVLGRPHGIVFRVDSTLRPGMPSSRDARGPRSAPVASRTVKKDPLANGLAPLPLFAKRQFASLDEFVVGDANRLAHSAVEAVARTPGIHTPLFLHGETGVGKTMLLEGLWRQLRSRNETRRVLYLTSEQFTTYFLEALNGQGLPIFRQKYRDTQTLIIDDIQFLSGKRATLIEFQHTIDAMLRGGRQIVLAADRRPHELPGFGPDLAARLGQGLVCELQPADVDLRRRVAAQYAAGRHIEVPADVLQLLAERVRGDLRGLSGAMNRLQAASRAYNEPVSMELAQRALADLWGGGRARLNLTDIERVVSEFAGVTPESMRSTQRGRAVSQSRMLAMWLARKLTKAAYAEIGQHFGRRSHSTVISARRTVDDWVRSKASLQLGNGACSAEEAIRTLEARLRA